MKLAYRFSNLLGTVYRKGTLNFTPDGNCIVSPVGNRLSIFDLKNNKSETLPVESQFNFTAVGISPDGRLAIAVNEEGEALLISLVSKSVLNNYHFHGTVHCLSFSPDGRKFAVTKGNQVLVFYAPGKTREYNPFVLYRTYYGAYDETLSIDWTSDSRAFVAGCRDMHARVHAAEPLDNLAIMSLGGQADSVVSAFFDENTLNVYSVAVNCRLVVWVCNTPLSGLKSPVVDDEKEGDEMDQSEDEEEEENAKEKEKREKKKQKGEEERAKKRNKHIVYNPGDKKKYKYKVDEGEKKKQQERRVTCAAFNKRLHLLLTGFEDGGFYLHEMPDFNLIHSLSISQQSLSSAAFTPSGEWLALGCAGLGQLLVWEWQSEAYILKQQGHFNSMACVAYSPDGMHVATGGQDAKVKVWNTSSGFCFVTFSEHLAGVTGVTFTPSGKVILSASLDGTVRAFDLNRYRNFRTLTSPHPVQFSCLAVDSSGEIVCAGAQDQFEVYVWSMKTGRLLEILAGHEGPVSSLAFASSGSHSILASGSWDKTVRLWDIFESKGAKEVIRLNSDVLAVAYRPDGEELAVASINAQATFWDPVLVLAVAYRPDGEELAVATINAQVTFWDVRNCTQTGSIEGRHDLGYVRKDTDKITAKKSAQAKAFHTLCYTADGSCLLAAGQSKSVCIYSVRDQLLMKKFEITQNQSLDGTQEFLDKRKVSEFGSLAIVNQDTAAQLNEFLDKRKMSEFVVHRSQSSAATPKEFLDKRKMSEFGSLALVDQDTGAQLSLPGVRSGDMAARAFKPEVRVTCVRFSPTGRAFVATSTEGLMLYSLDEQLVFDPFQLAEDVTPQSVRAALAEQEFSTALMLAFRLNEQPLIQQVFETIPIDQAAVIIQQLADVYVDRALTFTASQLESSRHIELYLRWCQRLLVLHGPRLKKRSGAILPALRAAQKALLLRQGQLSSLCDHNKYTLQYILSQSTLQQKKRKLEEEKSKMAAGDDVSKKRAGDRGEDSEGSESGDQAEEEEGYEEDEEDDDLMKLIRTKAWESDSESAMDTETMET